MYMPGYEATRKLEQQLADHPEEEKLFARVKRVGEIDAHVEKIDKVLGTRRYLDKTDLINDMKTTHKKFDIPNARQYVWHDGSRNLAVFSDTSLEMYARPDENGPYVMYRDVMEKKKLPPPSRAARLLYKAPDAGVALQGEDDVEMGDVTNYDQVEMQWRQVDTLANLEKRVDLDTVYTDAFQKGTRLWDLYGKMKEEQREAVMLFCNYRHITHDAEAPMRMLLLHNTGKGKTFTSILLAAMHLHKSKEHLVTIIAASNAVRHTFINSYREHLREKYKERLTVITRDDLDRPANDEGELPYEFKENHLVIIDEIHFEIKGSFEKHWMRYLVDNQRQVLPIEPKTYEGWLSFVQACMKDDKEDKTPFFWKVYETKYFEQKEGMKEFITLEMQWSNTNQKLVQGQMIYVYGAHGKGKAVITRVAVTSKTHLDITIPTGGVTFDADNPVTFVSSFAFEPDTVRKVNYDYVENADNNFYVHMTYIYKNDDKLIMEYDGRRLWALTKVNTFDEYYVKSFIVDTNDDGVIVQDMQKKNSQNSKFTTAPVAVYVETNEPMQRFFRLTLPSEIIDVESVQLKINNITYRRKYKCYTDYTGILVDTTIVETSSGAKQGISVDSDETTKKEEPEEEPTEGQPRVYNAWQCSPFGFQLDKFGASAEITQVVFRTALPLLTELHYDNKVYTTKDGKIFDKINEGKKVSKRGGVKTTESEIKPGAEHDFFAEKLQEQYGEFNRQNFKEPLKIPGKVKNWVEFVKFLASDNFKALVSASFFDSLQANFKDVTFLSYGDLPHVVAMTATPFSAQTDFATEHLRKTLQCSAILTKKEVMVDGKVETKQVYDTYEEKFPVVAHLNYTKDTTSMPDTDRSAVPAMKSYQGWYIPEPENLVGSEYFFDSAETKKYEGLHLSRYQGKLFFNEDGFRENSSFESTANKCTYSSINMYPSWYSSSKFPKHRFMGAVESLMRRYLFVKTQACVLDILRTFSENGKIPDDSTKLLNAYHLQYWQIDAVKSQKQKIIVFCDRIDDYGKEYVVTCNKLESIFKHAFENIPGADKIEVFNMTNMKMEQDYKELDTFLDDETKNGVVVFSKKDATGTDLRNTHAVYMCGWNWSKTELMQTEARALRTGSTAKNVRIPDFDWDILIPDDENDTSEEAKQKNETKTWLTNVKNFNENFLESKEKLVNMACQNLLYDTDINTRDFKNFYVYGFHSEWNVTVHLANPPNPLSINEVIEKLKDDFTVELNKSNTTGDKYKTVDMRIQSLKYDYKKKIQEAIMLLSNRHVNIPPGIPDIFKHAKTEYLKKTVERRGTPDRQGYADLIRDLSDSSSLDAKLNTLITTVYNRAVAKVILKDDPKEIEDAKKNKSYADKVLNHYSKLTANQEEHIRDTFAKGTIFEMDKKIAHGDPYYKMMQLLLDAGQDLNRISNPVEINVTHTHIISHLPGRVKNKNEFVFPAVPSVGEDARNQEFIVRRISDNDFETEPALDGLEVEKTRDGLYKMRFDVEGKPNEVYLEISEEDVYYTNYHLYNWMRHDAAWRAFVPEGNHVHPRHAVDNFYYPWHSRERKKAEATQTMRFLVDSAEGV